MADNDRFRDFAAREYDTLVSEKKALMVELYGSTQKAVDSYYEFLKWHTDVESPTNPLVDWFLRSNRERESILAGVNP